MDDCRVHSQWMIVIFSHGGCSCSLQSPLPPVGCISVCRRHIRAPFVRRQAQSPMNVRASQPQCHRPLSRCQQQDLDRRSCGAHACVHFELSSPYYLLPSNCSQRPASTSVPSPFLGDDHCSPCITSLRSHCVPISPFSTRPVCQRHLSSTGGGMPLCSCLCS